MFQNNFVDDWYVQLDNSLSSAVNVCPTVNANYLEAYTTLQCGMLPPTMEPTPIPTTMPTNSPTADMVVFIVDYSNGTANISNYDQETDLYECSFAGCSVTKTWEIIGQCDNPRLTIEIAETDFNSAIIHVNISKQRTNMTCLNTFHML